MATGRIGTDMGISEPETKTLPDSAPKPKRGEEKLSITGANGVRVNNRTEWVTEWHPRFIQYTTTKHSTTFDPLHLPQ